MLLLNVALSDIMARYGFPQCVLAERGRALLGYLILISGGMSALVGILLIIFGFTILGVISPYTLILEVMFPYIQVHMTNRLSLSLELQQ